MEPDASGMYYGASYMYATARDWAKFGLLYLNDGAWNGERILPQGWIDYSTIPSPHSKKGSFGAHLWINTGTYDNPENRRYPYLPQDLIEMVGYGGQYVVVIPSYNMVIVRMGMTLPMSNHHHEQFLVDILSAFKPQHLDYIKNLAMQNVSKESL